MIVADAPFPVYVHRQSDLRVIEANQGAIAALGYSREELLKLTPLDYDRGLTPDQIETLLAPLVAGELHKIEFPTVHRRKSGETFPVQVSVHTTEFGGESVYLCFVSDLTEIKSLERQLFQAEKWNSIGRLASGIAHEINTPIQFISNNVNYLRRIMGQWAAVHASVSELVGPGGNEELDGLREILPGANDLRNCEEALEDCLLGVARVSEIVGAMKEFAHPGGEDGAPFDINQCVRNAATITKNAAKKHATLELDLTDCDQVQGSSSELSQAFVNLIVNAADAIEEASLTGAESGRITVSTRQTRGRVVVKVSDTGCGMPPEVAAHAFDPFFTTKGVGKGSGQGLAIAYNAVVEKCGGEIKLDSSPGEGTTFTITLPAVCPVRRPAEATLAEC